MDECYNAVRVHIHPMKVCVSTAGAHVFLRHQSGGVNKHKCVVAEFEQLVQRPKMGYVSFCGIRGDAEGSPFKSKCVDSV